MNTGLPPDRIDQTTGAARKAAEELGVRVAIAIVDAGGHLAGFLRMPSAFLASSDLAIDKAWTAASFGTSTRGFGEMLENAAPSVRDGLLRRPRVTEVPGGVPILREGRVIGAIGISGGSEREDETIAESGLAAFGEA